MSTLTRDEREIRDTLQRHAFTVGDDYTADDRATLQHFRATEGFKRDANPVLLTQPDGNAKLKKGDVPLFSLSLSHARGSSWNVCPSSTPECRKHCVADGGKGSLDSVKAGRRWKTEALRHAPVSFYRLLVLEIDRAVAKHGAIGLRLNAFSDVLHEELVPGLFDRWGDAVRIYDYTKRAGRTVPDSYRLTLSATERTSETDVAVMVRPGQNVAQVFHGTKLPATYGGHPVIDGDKTDYRWGDPQSGVVVGLKAKAGLKTEEGKRSRFAR